jgi:hypothetical protein
LIAIAIADYALTYAWFTDIKSNFLLLEKSYLRASEISRVAYNGRTMVFLSDGWLTRYPGFSTKAEYVAAIKGYFSDSLDLIYKL